MDVTSKVPLESPVEDVDQGNVCPQCGDTLDSGQKFCTNCGFKIETSVPVTITVEPEEEIKKEDIKSSIMSQIKSIGDKAKEVASRDTASDVMTKAKEVKDKATGVMTPERASELMSNLVEIMIQVARDVRKQIPEDMIKAVDLEAEMNFVAFSIGVCIDLEQIQSTSALEDTVIEDLSLVE
jgi:hypothetical protein